MMDSYDQRGMSVVKIEMDIAAELPVVCKTEQAEQGQWSYSLCFPPLASKHLEQGSL